VGQFDKFASQSHHADSREGRSSLLSSEIMKSVPSAAQPAWKQRLGALGASSHFPLYTGEGGGDCLSLNQKTQLVAPSSGILAI
jgi:hypothetical protein